MRHYHNWSGYVPPNTTVTRRQALTTAAALASTPLVLEVPATAAPGATDVVAIYLDGETARNLLTALALAMSGRK